MKDSQRPRTAKVLIIIFTSMLITSTIGYFVYWFVTDTANEKETVATAVYDGPTIGTGEGELYPKQDFTLEEAYAGALTEPEAFLGGKLLATGVDGFGFDAGMYVYTIDVVSEEAVISPVYMGSESDRWRMAHNYHLSPSGEWLTFIGTRRARATSSDSGVGGTYVYRTSFGVGVHTEESIQAAVGLATSVSQQDESLPIDTVVNNAGDIAYAYAPEEPSQSGPYGIYIVEDSGDVHHVTEAGGKPYWINNTQLGYLSADGFSMYDTETEEYSVIVPSSEFLTSSNLDASVAVSPDAHWLSIGHAYEGPVQLYRVHNWDTAEATLVSMFDTNAQSLFFSPHSDFLGTVVPEDEETESSEGIVQFFPITQDLQRSSTSGAAGEVLTVQTVTTPAYSIVLSELLPAVIDNITAWTY